MELLYGTTNKAKLESMRRITKILGIEIIGLKDILARPEFSKIKLPEIDESGKNPLENAKIKAMAAPFPMFKVMPTGGISLKNLKEYISAPVICACGGSYMVTAELIDNQKWDEITDLCKQSVEIVKEARNNG